jgi:ribokinase
LGGEGALLVTASSSRRVPAIKVSAIDTTGAGDAFNAGLATALGHGSSLEDAVQFAIVAGGLAVTKESVIPSLPRVDEVLRCYRQNDLQPPDWFVAVPPEKN